MTEHSILLIDGSKASRAIISKTIQQQLSSARLSDFDTAGAALEHCQSCSFDLVITAMSLPDMQAQEFAEIFRKNHADSHTPIIMMSGDFSLNIKNDTASPHINGYFDKSRGNDQLIEYIQSYLSLRSWNKAPGCHVLFVEDSPTVTRVVTNMLENNGFSYQHVNNAADALTLLAMTQDPDNTNQRFDIVLTDIQIEGLMSGDDLIREIRFGLGLMPDQLPILVSTSPSPDRNSHINNIISAGANDIIEKPLIESLLIARISNLIK
ncbi:MAG: response regulator [Gammaproteobacteria bacterium]|nr:response regulator [Gammaproteobacteria bacterium]